MILIQCCKVTATNKILCIDELEEMKKKMLTVVLILLIDLHVHFFKKMVLRLKEI